MHSKCTKEWFFHKLETSDSKFYEFTSFIVKHEYLDSEIHEVMINFSIVVNSPECRRLGVIASFIPSFSATNGKTWNSRIFFRCLYCIFHGADITALLQLLVSDLFDSIHHCTCRRLSSPEKQKGGIRKPRKKLDVIQKVATEQEYWPYWELSRNFALKKN